MERVCKDVLAPQFRGLEKYNIDDLFNTLSTP